ncbi:hypothetical protein [uncultured Aureimonas sp.]|uniref:hypothetical protein n=1 Tax=uncultured Aureimonas sp. TaxID=1604662 RepID=UPI0025FB8B2A|nr:hypothetical protein [uncultured Aureimonas sp.]
MSRRQGLTPWQPILPSESTRKIHNRSKVSYRGSIINVINHRVILYESRLERNVFLVLMATVAYASFREQPPTVLFRDANGKDRKHTFDAFLVEPDGYRWAIDVKPASEVEGTGLRAAHDAIKEQIGAAYADEYTILTEQHAHPDDVADARLILRARRMPDADADNAVAAVVECLPGWSSVRDVVKQTGKGAAGFNALVRLIGDHGAEVYQDARISYAAYVTRAKAT